MRILWSAAAIVLGGAALALAAVGSPLHGRVGLGPRLAKMIVAGAVVAIGVLEFKPSANVRLLVTVVLGWTLMMAAVVWW